MVRSVNNSRDVIEALNSMISAFRKLQEIRLPEGVDQAASLAFAKHRSPASNNSPPARWRPTRSLGFR